MIERGDKRGVKKLENRRLKCKHESKGYHSYWEWLLVIYSKMPEEKPTKRREKKNHAVHSTGGKNKEGNRTNMGLRDG